MTAAQEKQAGKKTEAKVVDPVCGMEVDPKTSEKAVYKGKTYYFCSRSEKESFEKSPEKYVRPDKGKK
jgi:YHS domain-containing protein